VVDFSWKDMMRFDLAMIVVANTWAFNAYAVPATTLDWGLHDTVEAALIQPKGNVDDFILFAVKDATGVLSIAVSKDIDVQNGRRGGTVYLYFENTVDVLVGSYEFDGGTAGITHAFDLQPGDYYYRIVSSGPGASGGAYTLSSSLSAETALVEAGPVQDLPEPQSHALVLAGLAALGWFAKRRKP
jgi:hypothetical protein